MAIVGLDEFDVRFSITIISTESVMVMKETREHMRKTLESYLNKPRLIYRIKRHFELSQIAEARCEVTDLIVTSKS